MREKNFAKKILKKKFKEKSLAKKKIYHQVPLSENHFKHCLNIEYQFFIRQTLPTDGWTDRWTSKEG